LKRIEGEVRREVIQYGKLLSDKRLVTGISGNISGRIDEEAIVITPSGFRKSMIKEYDLIRMQIADGKVTAGGKPSVETPFHLAFYRNRPDVGGVVHGHPLFCTMLAVAGETIRTDLTPEGLFLLGKVVLVPYETPGSARLAAQLEQVMQNHDAFILENHGAIAVGKDVAEAFGRLETMEFLAELQIRTEETMGAHPLPPAEVEKILEMAGKHKR